MTDVRRALVWIGGSKKDFRRFPAEVQDDLMKALRLAQRGDSDIPGAKPLSQGVLKGLGVMELIDDFEGDAYRVAYTAKIGSVLAALHAFKKKSKSGISTPRQEIRLIRNRYRTAIRLHSDRTNRDRG